MGLGASYQPNCPQCLHSKVGFIFRDYDVNYSERPRIISELRPWWNSYSLYNGEVRYWACQNCINLIPKEYRDKFTYTKNYTVRGM